jgi:hypothetical protein
MGNGLIPMTYVTSAQRVSTGSSRQVSSSKYLRLELHGPRSNQTANRPRRTGQLQTVTIPVQAVRYAGRMNRLTHRSHGRFRRHRPRTEI